MENKDRFYVVERDRLGEYGAEAGYKTLDQANEALVGLTGMDLVVIKGRELAIKAVIQDSDERAD